MSRTTENETVEAAIDAVRKMIHDCPAIKGGLGEFGYQLKANGAIYRIEAAHRREVDAILKDRDEMYKSEQETIAKTNAWFEEYQTLKREVSELRECLEQACGDKLGTYTMKGIEVQRWRKALEGVEDDSTSR